MVFFLPLSLHVWLKCQTPRQPHLSWWLIQYSTNRTATLAFTGQRSGIPPAHRRSALASAQAAATRVSVVVLFASYYHNSWRSFGILVCLLLEDISVVKVLVSNIYNKQEAVFDNHTRSIGSVSKALLFYLTA